MFLLCPPQQGFSNRPAPRTSPTWAAMHVWQWLLPVSVLVWKEKVEQLGEASSVSLLSHGQPSPRSRLFSHRRMTNITTGTSSAWEFFQPVFRGQQQPFRWGGSYDIFFTFFLSVKSLLAPSVQQDGPQTWHHWKMTLLEAFIYLEFHSSTGHAGDRDSPCIFSGMFFSQALPKMAELVISWLPHMSSQARQWSLARLCDTFHSTISAACRGGSWGW